jgi:4-aminobutyrate aminotransferase
MSRQKPGSMGGTYAGNAVACAAATAVIQAFKDERVLDNVAARSTQLVSFLKKLQKDSPYGHLIEDVRGRGLMIGVQFKDASTNPGSQNATAAAAAKKAEQIAPKVVAECLKRDMLLLSTSVFDVLRFIPPLTISEEDLAKACAIFKDAFEAAAKALAR